MKESIGVESVRFINWSTLKFHSLFSYLAAFDVERVARDLDFTALQDNIEHITLCNIDAELVRNRFLCSKLSIRLFVFKDMRSMDPNFVKLYKIAQLVIEYLLVCLFLLSSSLYMFRFIFQICQEQINGQLTDYESIKSKSVAVKNSSSFIKI